MKRALALALLPSALFALDLTGTWQGYSNNPDTKESRRTVIKIASSDENPIKLNFYAPDLTYLVFPGTITVKGAATVRENGAPATPATGSNTGRRILRPSNRTGRGRSSATRSENSAILQTTPQLWI